MNENDKRNTPKDGHKEENANELEICDLETVMGGSMVTKNTTYNFEIPSKELTRLVGEGQYDRSADPERLKAISNAMKEQIEKSANSFRSKL